MFRIEHLANSAKCRVKLLGLIVFILLARLQAEAISPEAQRSLEKMQVAEGFEVTLLASEPEIRQPLSITFDERGRMWVIQYLQYPTPAGLKPVQVDNYLRTKYDRGPEPPPRGPKGADRITICEDTNGDGRYDKFKDFVTGLNLCTGMAIGYGGVFVVQAPYLLFYPDRNHDEVPDGDPEVLLTGFGLEDAHALANSLTWGPDGWLYGAQGSTVTANIRGIEFQQGIWRYHPVTHEFELFAEGGGNTWGVDFDEKGELIAGTNFDDKMLHQVQGAYYIKNFGKHGALHNPHAYGFFGHVPYTGYRGAHLSVGGVVYQGGSFPTSFRGTYISANTLDHAVYWHKLMPNKSSFTASFGGALLKTGEEIFRPVDSVTGPDGALYIADWCDKRATHVDPLDTWDRSNGRVYRIQAKGAKALPPPNLTKLSSDQLVDLLTHENDWFTRQARRILAERRDKNTYPRLRKQMEEKNARLALESLWTLYASGGVTDALALKFLNHSDEHVRAWAIRLLGDPQKVSPQVQTTLANIARTDSSPIVRRQLACSVKRLRGDDVWPVITTLLARDEDADDPQIPLLLWWAVESKTTTERAAVEKLFSTPNIQQRPLVRQHILERLARRYAAEATDPDFAVCAQLLKGAPSASEIDIILKGMEAGLVGRRFKDIPSPLHRWVWDNLLKSNPSDTLIRTAMRLGDGHARALAHITIKNERAPESTRLEFIEILGQLEHEDSLAPLLDLFRNSKSKKIRRATLTALQNFSDPSLARALLDSYPTLGDELQNGVRSALGSRAIWSTLLVDAVESGRIAAKDVSLDQVRQMAALKDTNLTHRIEKHWGKIKADSPQEKRNFINQVKLVLKPSGAAGRDAKGDPAKGRELFNQSCGLCHKLFAEGGAIGPDLTSGERKNIDVLLANIVMPSAYIRPEFVNFDAETKNGQSVSGLMAESTPAAVTLVDRNNQRHTLAREQIQFLRESELSLMPEGLLEGMQPQQLMDLFSYLQGEGLPAASK